jgi:signal transduction histidine kinase/CheY-like chemotaxis protein
MKLSSDENSPPPQPTTTKVGKSTKIFYNWIRLLLFFLFQVLAVILSIRIMKLDVESAADNLVSQAAGASRSLETQFDAMRDDFRVLVSTEAFDAFSDESSAASRDVALVKRFFARYQEMIDQIDLEQSDGTRLSIQLLPGNYLRTLPLIDDQHYALHSSPSTVTHSQDQLIIHEEVPIGAHSRIRNVRLRVDHSRFFSNQLASYLMGQSELWIWSIEQNQIPELIHHPSNFTIQQFNVHPSVLDEISSNLENGLEGMMEHDINTASPRKVISVYTPLNLGGESMGLVFSTDREVHLASLYRLATFLGLTFLGSLTWLASWFSVHVRKVRDSEREQATARKRAEMADRAKSEFVTTMSHEIRTPLNGVLGYANLLMISQLSPEQRNHVNIIRNSGDHLLTILNDILDFSKIESGTVTIRKESFSAIGCANEVVDMLQTAADERKIDLSIRIDPTLPQSVVGDSGRLRQVLYNLVGNGIKFTESGSVSLHLSSESHRESTILHFEVADTGIGIPEDKIDNLFAPFSQVDGSTSRNYGGTGLGLAICSRLIEMMGGTIQVRSRSGVGSVFSFSIPVSTTSALEQTIHPDPSKDPIPHGALPRSVGPSSPRHTLESTILQPSHPQQPRRKFNVLIAEDNETNSQLLKVLLEQRSCDTTITTNGSDALAELRRNPFDLVFMDVEMPGLDGLEVTRRVRNLERSKNTRPTRIIGLSAHAFNEARDEAIKAGMDDYLTKPIDILMLDKVIEANVARLAGLPT